MKDDKILYPFPKLTSERLVLRELLNTDGEEILLLRSDPQINKYLERQPCKSLDDALLFITKVNENIKNSPLKYWAITLKGNENLIGTICLFDHSLVDHSCEIGYELLREHQGKGLMKEAMKNILEYAYLGVGIKIVKAFTHYDNQNSTKLLQSLQLVKIELDNLSKTNLIGYHLKF